MTAKPTLSAGAVTRAAHARTMRRWTSTTIAPGVVRTTPRVIDGDTSEELERVARDLANYMIQAGWDVSRSGAVVTIVEPEPVEEPTYATAGIELSGEDKQPCPICGKPAEDFTLDRLGWTCSEECEELWGEQGALAVEVRTVGTITVVVTERGDNLGRVWVHLGDQDRYEGYIAAPADSCDRCPSVGSTLCDADGVSLVFPDRHAAVRALYVHADNGCATEDEGDTDPEGVDPDPIAGPDGLGAREMTDADTAEWHATMDREATTLVTDVATLSRGLLVVDTIWTCPACNAPITAVRGTDMRWYSECGGEGEGGCELFNDGDPAAEQSHGQAVAAARRAHGERCSLHLVARCTICLLPVLDTADRRPRLVRRLRDLSRSSAGRANDLGRRLVEHGDGPVDDGAASLMLLRAGHVALLAMETADSVEASTSDDLIGTVEATAAAYLWQHSSRDETPAAATVRFAVSRVALAARQIVPEEDRTPETV